MDKDDIRPAEEDLFAGTIFRGNSTLAPTKRKLETLLENGLPPAKKIRSVAKSLESVDDKVPPQQLHLNRSDAPWLAGHSDPRTELPDQHSSVVQWLDSLTPIPKYSQSDSFLCRRDRKPARRAWSAPAMGAQKGPSGDFATPSLSEASAQISTPLSAPTEFSSSGARGTTSTAGSGTRRNLVETPTYRSLNLAANNIYMRPLYETPPDHISNLVDSVVNKDRDSPGPSLEQIRSDADLNNIWMGTAEPKVEQYFKDRVFPTPSALEVLQNSDRQPMAKNAVPRSGTEAKISTPIPDRLYGYSQQTAFPAQQAQLMSMGSEMMATNEYDGLLYPFFLIEFKGDGGSMWVATNQCLGGSAACVNLAESLNQRLRACKSEAVQPIDSASFSIAMSGSEARLYISWKQSELEYYMASVDSFVLGKPEQYREFRKKVRNIIDWGKESRLHSIRQALDSLLEESRKRTSEAAKSRPPPCADNASKSSRKSGRSSSSHKSSRLGSEGRKNDE